MREKGKIRHTAGKRGKNIPPLAQQVAVNISYQPRRKWGRSEGGCSAPGGGVSHSRPAENPAPLNFGGRGARGAPLRACRTRRGRIDHGAHPRAGEGGSWKCADEGYGNGRPSSDRVERGVSECRARPQPMALKGCPASLFAENATRPDRSRLALFPSQKFPSKGRNFRWNPQPFERTKSLWEDVLCMCHVIG